MRETGCCEHKLVFPLALFCMQYFTFLSMHVKVFWLFQESWFEGVVTCKKNDTLEVVIEKIVKAEVIYLTQLRWHGTSVNINVN